MSEEPKVEMSEDAKKRLSESLRDAVMDAKSTEVVAETVHSILADIGSNLQMSIENASLRQQVEELEVDLASTKKDLKTKKMLLTKAETKIKRIQEKEKSGVEEEDVSEDESEDEEQDSFFDEPDSSSMEIVKGIIIQEGREGGGWASIQVVKDEAKLLDVELEDVEAIIDYWVNNEGVDIEKDDMNVRIKE